ncbi:putative Ig domain-containing protein [Myxococcota bacterium]|nr:putative Ig domain-containing protein [Myxococcota bacterium]
MNRAIPSPTPLAHPLRALAPCAAATRRAAPLALAALSTLTACAPGAHPLSTATSARGVWAEARPSGDRPSARDDHAMGYHRATERTVVIFDYVDQSSWTWDGTAWSEGPGIQPARSYARIAEDRSTGELVLFGGTIAGPFGTSYFDETATYSAGTWTLVNRTGTKPQPRHSHAMASLASGGVVIFGGVYGDDSGDVGEHGDTWVRVAGSWADATTVGIDATPSPRASSAAALDVPSGLVVLFGGVTTGTPRTFHGDTWVFDGAEWRRASSSGPSARAGASMVWDEARGRLLLFGGYSDGAPGSSRQYLDDLWAWDRTNEEWVPVDERGPTARASAGMAYDAERRTVVLFGGQDAAGLFDETWELTYTSTLAPAALTIVSGDAQTAVVGETAAIALVARVTDASGNHLSNLEVTFAPASGGGLVGTGGSFSPGNLAVRTDLQGLARASAQCGTVAGVQTFTASLPGTSVPAVTFTIDCAHAAAAYLELDLPLNAVVDAPVDATVRVFDGFDNPATSWDGLVSFSVAPVDPNATLPTNVSFQGQDGVLVLPRAVTVTRTGTFEVRVFDVAGLVEDDRVRLAVAEDPDNPPPPPPPPPENEPPVLTLSTSTVSVDEGGLVRITVTARDTGTVVIQRPTSLPEGASFESASGEAVAQEFFNWTPKTGQSGEYSVTFVARDAEGLQTTRTVRIYVAGSYYGCTAAHGRGGAPSALFLVALGLFVALRSLRTRARSRVAAILALGTVCLAAPSTARADDLFEERVTPDVEESRLMRKAAWLGLAATSSISDDLLTPVSEWIATQLSASRIYEVVAPSDVRAMIDYQTQRQMLGADVDPQFLASLGNKLGASRVVRGDLARVGDEWVLNLSLLDVGQVQVLARAARRVPGPERAPEPLLDAVRPLILDLLVDDPDASVGVRARELRAEKWDRVDGLYVHVTARGDADVIGKGLGFGAAVALGQGWFGGSLGVIIARPSKERPVALRLEGRFHPVRLGPVRPYLAAGTTAFLPEFGLRGALGAELELGNLLVTFDGAFEHFPSPAETRLGTIGLLSLGVGVAL